MKRKNTMYAAIAVVLTLGLAGCETKPEDIANWKEQGNSKKLIGTLNDSRQFIRIEAMAALKELKAPAAVDPLGALLSDPDVVIVHKALDAMAAIGGSSIEPYMLKAISFETAPARTTAATALGTCKSVKAVEPLISALDDEFEEVALAAAISLGQIGDPRATKALAAKTSSHTFKMHFACVTSLVQIGDKSTAPGLAIAMGDDSEKVRAVVVEGLVALGPSSTSYALEGLRTDNEFTRMSAAAILNGIGQVPTTGSDMVWYTLATIDSKAKADPIVVLKLAGIENGTDALLEAMLHPSEGLNAYAFQSLEIIGEPAIASVVAAAEQHAGKAAKAWFAGRSDWRGAPSWRIDYWGGLTALNPKFNFNPRTAGILANRDEKARKLMASQQFKPTAEYIPLLIAQCAIPSETANPAAQKKASRNSPLAQKNLLRLGRPARLPLIAGLEDADINIASACAAVLLKIDKDGARKALVEAFVRKVESGEDISGSAFLEFVTELNDPALDSLLAKIRPPVERAIQVAEEKYANVRFTNIPMQFESDKSIKAEPFRLAYLKNGRNKELKVIFRPDIDGNWVPTPPFPDALP
jgi:hypothetical protein